MAPKNFTQQQLDAIYEGLSTIEGRTNDLLLKFTYKKYKTEKAREYATHGFSRRISTAHRAIENIFAVVPPSMTDVPARNLLYDLQINIQACIANLYGCIDNLAWVWVYEQGLDKRITRNRVGLRRHNTEVRASLSAAFREKLQSYDDWLDYLIDFRDALAHRIPLYVPPGNVPSRHVEQYNALAASMTKAISRFDADEYEKLNAEQSKLLIFQPMMTHSVTETKKLYPFHVQLLADFATIEELAMMMLKDLSQPTAEF